MSLAKQLPAEFDRGDATAFVLVCGIDAVDGAAYPDFIVSPKRTARHDLGWLLRVGTNFAMALTGQLPSHADEAKAIHEKADVGPGFAGTLPPELTEGIRAELWTANVWLDELPALADRPSPRECNLLPVELDPRTGKVTHFLPYPPGAWKWRHFDYLASLNENAVTMEAAIVQANMALTTPSEESQPVTSILCFEQFDSKAEYLAALAGKLFAFKDRVAPTNADERFVHEALANEIVVTHRRRQVPASLTEGRVVYLADLWMPRMFLPGACLDGRLVWPVLAEPGPQGRIELLPHDPADRNEALALAAALRARSGSRHFTGQASLRKVPIGIRQAAPPPAEIQLPDPNAKNPMVAIAIGVGILLLSLILRMVFR